MSARGRRPPPPSSSPEGSDGNDTTSAPSEFLSEFLSAIMRRQYAEALKYCRLILHYEPQNAAARGFYPLLVRRAATQEPHADTSASDATSGSSLEVDSSSTSASGTNDDLDDVEDDTDPNGNEVFPIDTTCTAARTHDFLGVVMFMGGGGDPHAFKPPVTSTGGEEFRIFMDSTRNQFSKARLTGPGLLVDENYNAAAATTVPSTPRQSRRPRR